MERGHAFHNVQTNNQISSHFKITPEVFANFRVNEAFVVVFGNFFWKDSATRRNESVRWNRVVSLEVKTAEDRYSSYSDRLIRYRKVENI